MHSARLSSEACAAPNQKLKRFKCYVCKQAEMVTGGSHMFLCSKCKPSRLEHGRYVRQSILTGREEAMTEVAKAIRDGRLSHPSELSCSDCHGQATEYDHRDYRRPLDVDPVCRRCNLLRGPAIPVPGFFSSSIRQGYSPYRLNKRVRQLFEAIGADPSVLDDMPPLLTLDHWQILLPVIQAAAPELEPTKDSVHA